MNPVDDKKLEDLYGLLDLRPGAEVTDIGCGTGEMLIRLAERFRVKGVGVDKSPYCIREAKQRKHDRVPRAKLEFLELDGARYRPPDGKLSDLAMCIGATWIYGGYKNTLHDLSRMTRPLGRVMVGEPFWRKDPPQEYLDAGGLSRDSFSTHYDNATGGESQGLGLVYTLVSNEDAWDRYEALHWYAASQFALSNPQDPDLEDLLARNSRERESYLRYGRDTLGWAIYLFRKTS